jgi:hypothetical protein
MRFMTKRGNIFFYCENTGPQDEIQPTMGIFANSGDQAHPVGNVGVGMGHTNPGARFAVANGDVVIDWGGGFDGSFFSGMSPQGDLPSPGVIRFGGSGSGEAIGSVRPNGAAGQYGLNFYTNYQNRLHIANNGNVGIGTVNPNEGRLHVVVNNPDDHALAISMPGSTTPPFIVYGDGRIYAKRFRIASTNVWPDYVFDESYKLMGLDSVEAYILQHSHLPGMPSSAEVTNNGVDVYEQLHAQQQKIEELTLYLIEQRKLIDILLKERDSSSGN